MNEINQITKAFDVRWERAKREFNDDIPSILEKTLEGYMDGDHGRYDLQSSWITIWCG